jgi:hypothetical protein
MLRRKSFVASLLASGAWGALSGGAIGRGSVFSAAALREDLDQLWHALLAVGVYPFATSDRAAVTSRYRETRASLVEPADALSFVLKIAPVFGALNDGHVGVRPDEAFMDALAVPVRCSIDGDATIVLASYENRVEPGSTLLSLGGVPAQRIRDITLAGWGGQTERLRNERFASGSRIVATILAGNPSSFEVRWKTPGGIERHATLPRAAVALPYARSPGYPYSYRGLGDGSIGLIDYRQCVGLETFRGFLHRTFATVRAAGVRAMIVDIRNNSGGNSELNNVLWGYLTTKTFTQFGPVVMRSSEYLKRLYGKSRYVEVYGPETWDARDGTLVTYSQAKIGYITAQPNRLRFTGPVALLIGPRTFSSALDCAIAAKDFGLATIVGEETSEPVETTGELFEFTTRNTAITGSFTTKYFLPPKRTPPGRGVAPDVEVRTTLEDVLAGRDPVLARAVHEFHRGSSAAKF